MITQIKAGTHLIEKILKARSLFDLLDVNRAEVEYKQISKAIHPDICPHPRANAAMAHLNALKHEFDHGKLYHDDAGPFRTNGKTTRFLGDKEFRNRSLENYLRLMRLRDKSSLHFQHYLPRHAWVEDNAVTFETQRRAIPLARLLEKDKELPQHHVNWILSRMLEFSSWLAQVGYVHAGLHPESVFVVPETHGIIVTSFYHLTKIGKPIKTLSANHQHWYTPSVFTEKKAVSLIDTELCKKTAAFLLGDPSGGATRLRRTHNKEIVDFLIRQDRDPYRCYTAYRKLLKRNFKKRFYPLHV